MTIERKRYLETEFDVDKASVGFTQDEFDVVVSEVKKQYRQIQMNEKEVPDAKRAFLYNIREDLKLIDEQGTPFEIWMEYHILEELYHIVGRCDARVQAVFQDSIREFEHLDDDPF